MDVYEVLSDIMAYEGLSIAQVAKKCGLPDSTVRGIVTRKQKTVSLDVAYKLSDGLGVSLERLNGMEEPDKNKERSYDETHATDKEFENIVKKYRLITEYSPDGAVVVDTVLDREYSIANKLRKQKEQLEKVQKMDMEVSEEIVPLRLWAYYGKIACAGTGFIFDDIPSDTVQAPDTNADFIIGVNGDSMEPDYSDGEKLYIKKVERINPGEVGIFTINNECFLKEYGKDGLVSRNKKYDDIPGNEDVRLIGKVVGKVEE